MKWIILKILSSLWLWLIYRQRQTRDTWRGAWIVPYWFGRVLIDDLGSSEVAIAVHAAKVFIDDYGSNIRIEASSKKNLQETKRFVVDRLMQSLKTTNFGREIRRKD